MKLGVLLFVNCFICCVTMIYAEEETIQNEDIPLEASDSSNSFGAMALRVPQAMWRWGQLLGEAPTHLSNMMKNAYARQQHQAKHRIKNNRTLTRRESSLVTPKKHGPRGYDDDEAMHTFRGYSNVHLNSISGVSLATRTKGSVQRELVTLLFESMLDTIVEQWCPIDEPKKDDGMTSAYESVPKGHMDMKDLKKKKPTSGGKTVKARRSRSKQDLYDIPQSPSLSQTNFQSLWSSPDERAIIRFRNGNIYEGSISMKCMNGAGRFQWADGTVFMGQFKENIINGKGMIQWKDDTWYEGDFVNNLRHGHGLYVNSRKQSCYSGDWYCGAKHGLGVIHYTETFKNSYDGEWDRNIRQGYGVREYDQLAGYKGEWNRYTREGEGLMIWPNHDVYKGQWENGVMCGSGIYVWETYYNSTLSVASLNIYRGYWKHGQRHGHGLLDLGLGGSLYKGEFVYNKKHGIGKFVTNNGLILQDKELFIDDNFGPRNEDEDAPYNRKYVLNLEPLTFHICDDTVGLHYHIKQSLYDIDIVKEGRAIIISDYFENNGKTVPFSEMKLKDDYRSKMISIIEFEELALQKALECYKKKLINVYNTYATICNSEEIEFKPVLIRLFLWQLYHDCHVLEKGLTLVEIDRMYHDNPVCLSRSAHDPFEKIFFWQFIHSLINVAKKLYAQKILPSTKPDTILAKAFRTFMDNDLLPNIGLRRGNLTSGIGEVMPLKALYKLYRSLGEPHSVRTFLRVVRYPVHWRHVEQPDLVDEQVLPPGRNMYVIGDGLNYVTDRSPSSTDDSDKTDKELKLFNFGNLSSKTIIKNIFSNIFPHIYAEDKVVNLDIKMTFYEFFEAFVNCAEESIKVKEEEIIWRNQLQVVTDQSLLTSNKNK